jgi:hypothetical protein
MRPAYSIKFRLQRTVKESAFVSVPITPDLLKEDGYLDAEKAMQLAVRMGELESVSWEVEGEPVVEPHPLQLPPT